jgi:hypothetical protein
MFAACAFPVHTWSIVILLRELPAWILRLNIWDLIGVMAYPQTFALIESLIILLVSLLMAALLPGKWFRDKVVALNAVVVFSTAAWAIVAQISYGVIRTWSARSFLPWLAAYLLSTALFYALVYRHKRLEALIVSFVDRLLILAYIYLFVDILSVLVVVIRNIGGSVWPS